MHIVRSHPQKSASLLLKDGEIDYSQLNTDISNPHTICSVLTSLTVGPPWLFQPYATYYSQRHHKLFSLCSAHSYVLSRHCLSYNDYSYLQYNYNKDRKFLHLITSSLSFPYIFNIFYIK